MAAPVALEREMTIPISADEQLLLEQQAKSRNQTVPEYVRDVIQFGLWVIREREGGADVAAKRPDGRSAVLKAIKK